MSEETKDLVLTAGVLAMGAVLAVMVGLLTFGRASVIKRRWWAIGDPRKESD